MSPITAEPADFIQSLAIQNQVLACVKWLGEFQVLACIPLSGNIAHQDVADLAGVPETQLCRVVRMTATAGFLHEPQPGRIAHTPLSAPFVTNLAFLDAVMFLAETAAPAALHMVTTTPRHEYPFAAPQLSQSVSANRTRLQRQWSAYRRCTGDVDDGVTELLARLNWRGMGNAYIVDVCADSTDAAMALAETYPSLRFVVQLAPEIFGTGEWGEKVDGRVTVQERRPASVQAVTNAAVYLLRLTTSFAPLLTRLLAELRAHLDVLRENAAATLILTVPLLPEPGAVSPDAEVKARLRNLSRLQLTNQDELDGGELLEAIKSVGNSSGRLVVASKLRCPQSSLVALGLKYQSYADRPHTAEPLMTMDQIFHAT